MTISRQSWETQQAFERRIVRHVRSSCEELLYEIDTGRPALERVAQMIEWLTILAEQPTRS